MSKKKIKKGEVKISNRPFPHRPSSKIHEGETVTVTITKTTHEDEYWKNQKIILQKTPEIIFEDEGLVVISKPPFMSTHPTGKHLFYCATVFFEAKYNKTVHSVHRLDRETSGVLLIAKTPKVAAKLTKSFENGLVRKCYFFIGKKNENFKRKKEFDCNKRLGSSELNEQARVLIEAHPFESTKGKHAYTSFNVLREEGEYLLGLAFPKTGRQHQIRVHAKESGFPLVGDKIYLGGYKMFQRFKDLVASTNDFDQMDLPRHALHAIGLKIDYPTQNKFISQIPQDLKEWIVNNLVLNIEDLEKEINRTIQEYFQKN